MSKKTAIGKMQAELLPTPNEKLATKYDYFYRGYNLETNTKRFMSFDNDYDPEVFNHYLTLL